jgi:membrane-associated phospholipid phosphatase
MSRTAALWLGGQSRSVVAGLASSALLVLVAHAARRWLKISLHVAFAVFSAVLLWPRIGAVAALLILAVAVAWSRLVLGRHTRREVVS